MCASDLFREDLACFTSCAPVLSSAVWLHTWAGRPSQEPTSPKKPATSFVPSFLFIFLFLFILIPRAWFQSWNTGEAAKLRQSESIIQLTISFFGISGRIPNHSRLKLSPWVIFCAIWHYMAIFWRSHMSSYGLASCWTRSFLKHLHVSTSLA